MACLVWALGGTQPSQVQGAAQLPSTCWVPQFLSRLAEAQAPSLLLLTRGLSLGAVTPGAVVVPPGICCLPQRRWPSSRLLPLLALSSFVTPFE